MGAVQRLGVRYRRAGGVVLVAAGLVLAAYGLGRTCNCMSAARAVIDHEFFLYGMRFYSVLAFGALVLVTQRLGERLIDRRTGMAAAGLLFLSLLANHAIIAWTHVPTAVLTMTGLLAYHSYLRDGGAGPLAVVGLSAGLVFSLRYLDVVVFLPIGLDLLYRTVRQREIDLRPVLAAGAVFGLLILPSIAFHIQAFGGPLESPYHVRDQALPPNERTGLATDFDPSRLPATLWLMLAEFDPSAAAVDSERPDFRFSEYKLSLLQTTPLFVLALAGIPVLLGRDRRFALVLVGQVVTILAVYGSWVYFSGGWTTNMRYLSTIVPVIAVATAAGIGRLVRPDRLLLRSLSGIVLVPLILIAVASETVLGSLAAFRPLATGSWILVAGAYAATWYVRDRDDRPDGPVRRLFDLAAALAVAVSIVAVYVFQNGAVYVLYEFGSFKLQEPFLLYPTANVLILSVWALVVGVIAVYLSGAFLRYSDWTRSADRD